jgi:hypothetical protein
MVERKSPAASADFVAKIVKDPKQPPDTLVLTGYLGTSSEEGHTRLYFDKSLSSYVEIPNDAILHTQDIVADQGGLGGTYVWIKRDAELIYGPAGSQRPRGKFLEGPIMQAHLQGAAVGGAGALPQTALCEPTPLCGHSVHVPCQTWICTPVCPPTPHAPCQSWICPPTSHCPPTPHVPCQTWICPVTPPPQCPVQTPPLTIHACTAAAPCPLPSQAVACPTIAGCPHPSIACQQAPAGGVAPFAAAPAQAAPPTWVWCPTHAPLLCPHTVNIGCPTHAPFMCLHTVNIGCPTHAPFFCPRTLADCPTQPVLCPLPSLVGPCQ